MKPTRRILSVLFALFPLAGCMEWDYGAPEEFRSPGAGLFILNEGSYQYGNASLSYYDPAARQVENEVFYRANAMRLGDVAQSMTLRGDRAWIVVNNSQVVFAVDPGTFRERGRITGFTSPRYICFLSDEKAYVSQLWDNRIFIVDPQRYAITGCIECPGMTPETGSTEQMVLCGDYLYVCCWSYQNRLLKIDTRTDRVVAELEVGIQPRSLALDCRGKLWVLTDGGYEGSPYGYEAPALFRIDPESLSVEREFRFRLGGAASEVRLNGTGDLLYWIDDSVWRMPVDSETLPAEPFVAARDDMKFYGLSVDPRSGDVYVADAVDHAQPGTVYRYAADDGMQPVDEFRVGVTPSAFCWKYPDEDE